MSSRLAIVIRKVLFLYLYIRLWYNKQKRKTSVRDADRGNKMSYFDDDDDRGLSLPVIYTILAVAGIVLILILVVVSQNRGTKGSADRKTATPSPVVEALTTEDQADEGTQGLRSEDLDFWNMYGERTEQETEKMPEETAIPTPSPSMEPSPTPTEDPAYQNVKKNTVDYTKLKTVNDQMAYYPDGFDHTKTSRLGVELSKDSGQVDFDWLKRNGVDFVMLKAGGRGYESGVISLDEKFTGYLEAAEKAGLDIGVIFYSQAVSVNEAVEEAEFVVSQIKDKVIRYPVALVMETITNDDARTDTLSKDQRSQIAEAFLQTVTYDGYHGILYGDGEWLLNEIRPDELLVSYDVMLDDTAAVPEYPYEFKMWKYETGASLAGVEFGGDYVISFVDYSMK